ncbi:head GIN domain-containing protein [Tenacibaculum geojense]|uniref:Head GIN domain-containing protein n=1 Tax=Tenacibaculum geojense TaxID=915352 RepID=A0ABW3JTD5_9FLAO
MKKLLVLSTVLLTCFTACSQWWGGEKIKGNGNVINEKRPIDSFENVTVGGSFDVYLVDGKEGQVNLEGEENILPYIITEVDGKTLKIKFKNNTNIKTTRRLIVTVPFEQISAVSLGGSGNVVVKKEIKTSNASFSIGGSGDIEAMVTASNIKGNIGGSGSIKLSGSTDDFKCSIAGSGSIHAYELTADNLKANIAGSGSIQTSVKTKIKANVVGSGSVYYKGNPKYVDSNAIGSGDVIKRD